MTDVELIDGLTEYIAELREVIRRTMSAVSILYEIKDRVRTGKMTEEEREDVSAMLRARRLV